MVDNQKLKQLVSELANETDSVEAIGKAFSEIGEFYGIAGIQLEFFVEEPMLIKESVEKKAFL